MRQAKPMHVQPITATVNIRGLLWQTSRALICSTIIQQVDCRQLKHKNVSVI
jgi:hypothetical protein